MLRGTRANMNDRYSTSHLIEDQYEPGSNSLVLRNKLGIIDKNAGRPPPELAFERGIRSLTVLHT